MTDEELVKRLQNALDNTAPDDFAAVLARCGTEKGSVIEMAQNRERPRRKHRALGLAAACLALLLVGGGGVYYQQTYAVASVISLDVNPSIELRINSRERVLSCTALNADGAAVLADMGGGSDLEGAKLDVAVNAVVGALVRSGYLDRLDSALLISVEDKDAQRGARLQQELETSVGVLLQSSDSQATVMGQSLTVDAGLEAQAQQNSISTGKAYLVDQVVAMNDALDFDQLAALSVEELRDMRQTGAKQMPIGKAAAAAAAESWAGTTAVDSVTAEVDPELDEAVPCYEVELRTPWGEYEYTIDAYTGAVLSGAKDILSSAPSSGTGGKITKDQALAAAAADAGVTPESYTVRLEQENGRSVYDVKLYAGGREYEYEIDAASGNILSRDVDRGPDGQEEDNDHDDPDDVDDRDDLGDDDDDDDDDDRPAVTKATAKPVSQPAAPKATAKSAAAPSAQRDEDDDDNDDDDRDDDDEDDKPAAAPVQSKPAQSSAQTSSGGGSKSSQKRSDDDDDEDDRDDDDGDDDDDD